MKEPSRLFSYIVAWDAGLAPNPYWDYCTLAVCKPKIRKSAKEGDWIVGISPRETGYHLVYAMKVMETLSFDEYFQDGKFELKKPNMKSSNPKILMGDNFYEPGEEGSFIQLPSSHTHYDGSENTQHKQRDLSGEKVLAAMKYYYFGVEGPTLPTNLSYLEVGRGHRNHFDPSEITETLRFLDKFDEGIHGDPRDLERGVRWLRNKER